MCKDPILDLLISITIPQSKQSSCLYQFADWGYSYDGEEWCWNHGSIWL